MATQSNTKGINGYISETDRIRGSSSPNNGKTVKSQQATNKEVTYVSFGVGSLPDYQFRIDFKGIRNFQKVVSLALFHKSDDFKKDPNYLDIKTFCILLFLGNVAYQFAAYFSGLLSSEFYLVLISVDKGGYVRVLIKSIFITLSCAFVLAANNYFTGIVQAKARRILTGYTQGIYIKKNVLITLVSEKKIDNPDQRITQDIDKLSAKFMEVISTTIISPAVIIYYTIRTWLITGYYGPLSIYIYFIIGSVFSLILIPKVASKVYHLEKAEGFFRNQHVKLRDDAEEISFMHGEKKTSKEVNKYMQALYVLQRRVVSYTFPIFFLSQFLSYLGAPLSYAIIGIPLFSGSYNDKSAAETAEIISKSSFMSMYLIYSFTQVLSTASSLANLIGYAIRITQLWDELERLNLSEKVEYTKESPDNIIETENLTVISPAGKTLFSSLNLKVEEGHSLLITGPNGCGKTSLIRAIGGIWKSAQGNVYLPFKDGKPDLYILPQRTILVNGSLVDQIIYPKESQGASFDCDFNEKIVKIVQTVGLSHLLKPEYYEGIINDEQYFNSVSGYNDESTVNTNYSSTVWNDILSPGEQQRLSLARIIYWCPKYAILDESTSSLDLETEAKLYAELIKMNITLVSVSHRQSLEQFHSNVLRFDSFGSYKLGPI